MRALWTVFALCALVGCGKDPQPIQVTIDVGGADMGGETPDATSEDASMGGETPRDDLEVVVMDREVTFVDGESERLAFDVSEDAVSVVVAVTGDKGRQYALAEWTNGDGSSLVPRSWLTSDAGAPSLCLTCPNRIAASESSFAAIAPNNEGVTLAAGTHNITAYGFTAMGFVVNPLASGTARVRVVVKRRAAQPDVGKLDLNFYLTGARGWSAATAPTEESFLALLADVEEIYAQVGLELGTLTYTDIGEEYGVIENVLFGPEIQELFELSADAPRTGLNVFLVDELFVGSGPGFGVLLGISGGIPGPPMGGTPRSGVAVNTRGDPALAIATGSVIAHEIGHHLGLFHSTESQGGVHDPIDDTEPDDRTLLMFHASDGTILTETQGQVMRSNPWVHHEEAP